jgi:hypothetical protein
MQRWLGSRHLVSHGSVVHRLVHRRWPPRLLLALGRQAASVCKCPCCRKSLVENFREPRLPCTSAELLAVRWICDQLAMTLFLPLRSCYSRRSACFLRTLFGALLTLYAAATAPAAPEPVATNAGVKALFCAYGGIGLTPNPQPPGFESEFAVAVVEINSPTEKKHVASPTLYCLIGQEKQRNLVASLRSRFSMPNHAPPTRACSRTTSIEVPCVLGTGHSCRENAAARAGRVARSAG